MEDPLAVDAPEPGQLPSIYFNGFTMGVGNADVTLQIRLENKDIVVLKCSYTVAKTLAEKLAMLVKQFQKATDHDIMTTETVAAKLKAAQEKGIIKPLKPNERKTAKKR